MEELYITLKDLWIDYYPIVVTVVVATGTFIGGAYVIYTQATKIVQPILDKIQTFRDKDDDNAILSSQLEDIKLNILKADLLAKISNPTISPELTLFYQSQLDKLENITTITTDLVDEAEETADKYL